MEQHVATNAHDSHQQWLSQMAAQYAAHMANAGAPAPANTVAQSPLPAAPMMWAARPEEANDAANEFAGVALDSDDFDAPVYRSLGGLFSSGSAGSQELTFGTGEDFYDEEAPVYRSLPAECTAAAPAPTAEEAQREWLATMPPLVQRQRAHGASLALDLGL
jgi:hypothetical protein